MRLLAGTLAAILWVLPAPAAKPPSLPAFAPVRAASTVATLDDVEGAFEGLRTRGDLLTAVASPLIPRPAYRATFGNGFGFDNHLQGIQGFPGFVVISGANAKAPAADLFVVRLNGEQRGEVVTAIRIADDMWHAGGISAAGHVLAVPVYGRGGRDRQSRVIFFDMSDPAAPVRLPASIDRTGRKAVAVAMTQLVNHRWLVAVLSGRDGLPRRLDFYLSRSSDVAEGFGEALSWQTAFVRARNGQAPSFSHFQNINFLSQADGRLYLVGFHNTFINVAALPGRDYADLYEIALPECVTRTDAPALYYPQVTKVANKRLECRDGSCNMDAAAGTYVDIDTRQLSIYATPGWIDGDVLKITRYGS